MSADVLVPSLVHGMPDAVYHADPIPGGSLSSSGARRLLPPSCPAIFDHERTHGRKPRAVFDLGHAAHRLVLGTGPDLVVVDADDWRTAAAKAARKAAHDAGTVPLLPHEHAQVLAMAAAIKAHPVAGRLFDPRHGDAEVSLFWRDEPTGVALRARLDWLMRPVEGKRVIVADYKTAVSAEPNTWARAAADHGYHQQDPWYLDGVRAVLGRDAGFVFVVQEKEAPYVVSVVELAEPDRAIGRERNRRAIDLYAHCQATGHWPPYAEDVVSVELPVWVHYQHEQEQHA